MGKYNQDTQYKKELQQMTDRFRAAVETGDRNTMLWALPNEYDAQRLTKAGKREVSLAMIYNHIFKGLPVTQEQIAALKKEKHIEDALRCVENIKDGPRDLIEFYVEELEKHLDGAGYAGNHEAGLVALNSSADEIKKARIEAPIEKSTLYNLEHQPRVIVI